MHGSMSRHGQGSTINLFRDAIAALGGARNPHVQLVHSGFSGPVRLALKSLTTINSHAKQALLDRTLNL